MSEWNNDQNTNGQNETPQGYNPERDTPKNEGGLSPYGTPPAQNAHTTQTPGGETQSGYGGYQYGKQPEYPGGAEDPWRFNSYDTAAVKPHPRKRRKSGMKIFGAILGTFMGIVVLSFAVFGLYALLDGEQIVDDAGVSGISQQESLPSSQQANENTPDLSPSSKPSDNTTVPSADGILTTSQIYKKVAPSIVGIIQYKSTYFEPTGEGSGIILSSDGYIATNAHVIDGADSIEVVLNDGTTYKGTVIGVDKKTDLAVVKIDAKGLTPAEFGSSSELVEGEKAVAIGNPGGVSYAGSISQGVISGLNRNLRAATDGYTMNFIQTDAAISPGNSGGALVNEFGQVVGINSQKLAESGYEGIGFAIPIDEAIPILNDLMRYGHVTGRVKLGISAYAINEYAASVNGIPAGILIDSIEEGSSLTRAGVQAGDLITAVDGTSVNSFTGLNDLLRGYSPGDTVTLTIFRANYTSQSGGSYRPGSGGQSVTGNTFDVEVTLMEDIGTTN